jgi:chorismate-pyruvate lyase
MNLRAVVAFTGVVCARSYAQEAPAWPDTYVSRLQALALLQTLNAEVLASQSATRTLEGWCRDHRLATEPTIVANVISGVAKPPTPEQRQRLHVTRQGEVKYRRVQLRCGSRVLPEADNWYVPGRLTAEMNRLLETTGTPFGKVVRPLDPYRRTFAVKLLWSPLPDGWERNSAPPSSRTDSQLSIPEALFEHRAVLYTREHKPFSEVHEVYRRQILAFPPPR